MVQNLEQYNIIHIVYFVCDNIWEKKCVFDVSLSLSMYIFPNIRLFTCTIVVELKLIIICNHS